MLRTSTFGERERFVRHGEGFTGGGLTRLPDCSRTGYLTFVTAWSGCAGFGTTRPR